MREWIDLLVKLRRVHVGDGVYMTMHGLGREKYDRGECMGSEVKGRD